MKQWQRAGRSYKNAKFAGNLAKKHEDKHFHREYYLCESSQFSRQFIAQKDPYPLSPHTNIRAEGDYHKQIYS